MFGMLLVVMWFLFLVLQGMWYMHDALSMSYLLLFFLAVAFFIPVILVSNKKMSNNKQLVDLVSVRQIRWGQNIGVGIVVLYTFWSGDTGFLSVIPIWVIFIAAGVFIPCVILSRK